MKHRNDGWMIWTYLIAHHAGLSRMTQDSGNLEFRMQRVYIAIKYLPEFSRKKPTVFLSSDVKP